MKSAYTVETSKIVGSPGSGFWSQVHTFFPKEPEKKEKRGILLAVLVVARAGEGIEAVATGREILGRLHEEYYGNLEGNAFSRLGETVEKLVQENENLEIVAACLVGQVIYLAIYGGGEILLKRGEKMGIVLEGGSDELKTGSGFLEGGDFILLGSGHFFQIIGPGVIRASLESNSLDEMVEILTPVILGRKNVSDAAAILALVREEEQIPIKPVAPAEEEKPLPSWREKKKPFLGKIFGWLKLPQKRSFFVHRPDSTQKKKRVFVFSLVILVFLLASLGFGVRKALAEKKEKKIKALAALAEQKFNQGKVSYPDKPGEGKAFIEEAKKVVEEGLLLRKNNQELRLLKEQMERFLANMGQEVTLSEVPVFMDLSLITDGGSGVSFSLLGKDLVILDQAKKKLYLLDIEKKSHEIIEYPTSEGVTVTCGQRIFVFDSKGIFEVSPTAKSVTLKVNKDGSWKEIVGFGTFGGNLYLLDRGSKTIWRYLASGDGFGAKKNWFISSPPDLSSAISLTIDGSVWILGKDKILKFTLGEQENFSLSKMPASPQGGPESFSDPVRIYTSEESQNLYVLDKGRKKVFVIAKSGEFKASYAWEGIKQATDLVAVESMKKIFLLSGAKIYEIGMK